MTRPGKAGPSKNPSNPNEEPDRGAELRELIFKDLLLALLLEVFCYFLLWIITQIEIHFPIKVPDGASWWHHTNIGKFLLWFVHVSVIIMMVGGAVLYIVRPITNRILAWLRSMKRKKTRKSRGKMPKGD